MTNYREEIVHSWAKSEPSARALAALLGLGTPVTLRQIVDRLRQVETMFVQTDINTDDDTPINGHAALELRSDGSYVFSGHMRATGFPSYHYAVQAWASSGEGTVIAAQENGRVFGTDTPGPRQRNWTQPGVNAGIGEHWRALRASHTMGYHLRAEIGGVLGGAIDVLKFAVEGIAANALIGPAGWYVLIGNELAGMDSQIASPTFSRASWSRAACCWWWGRWTRARRHRGCRHGVAGRRAPSVHASLGARLRRSRLQG